MAYRLAEQPQVPPAGRNRVAFRHGGRELSFAELDDRAGRFANGALATGLVPGDRVLLVTPNALETFEVLIGCARAGLVAVPLNWRLAPQERAAVVADCDPRAVVADAALGAVAAERPLLHLSLGPVYEDWLAHQPGSVAHHVGHEDRVVLRVYTSGTSGLPKGVQLTNANLAAKVPRVSPHWGLAPDSVSLLATPLFHVGALSWGLAGLFAGATTVLAGDASAAALLRHLTEDRVSHTFLVPAMIARICTEAPAGARFPALRTIVYGASPIAPETQRDALALFGPVLRQVYGLSETTGGVTEQPAGLAADDPRQRSAGRPYPWVELAVRDPETGAPVGVGEFGEVWTRSAQNTPGYAGLPDETARLLTGDGWLRTGDGGYVDGDGYLFLTDRVKDLIISGGENVYPAEVETVIREHPDVADVAVFGIPDSRWGEAVAAAVVPRDGRRVDPGAVIGFATGRLAGYKRPRTVIVVDDLPRNPTGKVLRRRLQELIA
jgi:long-chain acyl-CoA synthetase